MKDEEFDNLMSKYKRLPLKMKKEELVNKTKEIISILVTIGEAYNKKIDLLYNKEISDLKTDYTENDYFEALYAYIYMLENAIEQLLNNNN